MTNMKIHIPTQQYGFIEKEVETVEEAYELQEEIKDIFNPKSSTAGLSRIDFNKAIDRYLTDGTGETETYIAMSREQQSVIQEIKKSMARLSSKE